MVGYQKLTTMDHVPRTLLEDPAALQHILPIAYRDVLKEWIRMCNEKGALPRGVPKLSIHEDVMTNSLIIRLEGEAFRFDE